jgi:hypothetical protein
MNAVTPVANSAPITAPYSVDVSQGSRDGTVSHQWMSRPADQRFETLGALHRFKRDEHIRSWESQAKVDADFELLAPPARSMDDTHKMMVGINRASDAGADVSRFGIEVAPTHHAFTQLCQLGKAPSTYLRTLPSQLAVQAANWSLKFNRQVDQVKLYADDACLKAATGPSYGRIPDHEIIAALMQIAGDGLGQDGFHWKTPGTLNWSNGTYDPEDIGDVAQRTFYGSDRDMFVFLVDDRRPIVVGKTKTGAPDHMFRGFYIQNSEVGTRSLKISAFYLRGVCMNRNLWGCEGFEEITLRHSALAPDRWLHQAMPALKSFASGSERKLIQAVQAAKSAELATTQDEALAYLRSMEFSARDAAAIWERHDREEEQPMRSVWDFAQGITAFARDAINTDDRLATELKAKKILDKVA